MMMVFNLLEDDQQESTINWFGGGLLFQMNGDI